jgi:two-component system, NarL family, sensor histidine kinase UhpB
MFMPKSISARATTERRSTAVQSSAKGKARQAGAAFLRMPLFYKLIIANGVITIAAVLACGALIARSVRADPSAHVLNTILPVALAGILIGVVVNAVVVRLALTPIRALELAAEQVRSGDESARAVESPVSDASTERLVQTFNSMLDSLAIYRERLREIAIRALDAGENERLRLSKELHDDLAQSLAALLVQLKVARGSGAEVESIAGQLAVVIEQVRALATQLRPAPLDMLGLRAALTAHARSVSEATGLQVEVQVDDIDALLSKEAELALYRMIQEALLNVVRHGETKAARLIVRRDNGNINAVITDRGRGFAVGPTLAGGALGLIGMVERAAYVGGSVNIDSEPGRGTTIRIDIPVEENAPHA